MPARTGPSRSSTRSRRTWRLRDARAVDREIPGERERLPHRRRARDAAPAARRAGSVRSLVRRGSGRRRRGGGGGRGSAAACSFALTNADGAAAEMSGNGMRCVGAWLRDTERVGHGASFDVETPAGIKHVWLTLDGATVAMGQPNFTKAAIPMRGPAWETFQDQPFDAGDGRTMRATALSMGNPHLVLFTDEDPERYHLEHMGPALEHHELFPERTNVEFARIAEDGVIDVRVWERGVGETLACGTGACAVAVAGNERGDAPG